MAKKEQKKYTDKWWKDHYEQSRKTRGKLEGIPVREEIAKAYEDGGDYSKSAEVWQAIAEISEKHPDSEYDTNLFRGLAKRLRRESRRSEGTDITGKVLGFITILGLIMGLFFLSFNVIRLSMITIFIGVDNVSLI